MRRYLTLAMLPLTACTVATSNATADNPPQAPGTSCRNEALAQFTGQPRSEELGKRMLRAGGGRILRWVPPGTAVTMDFNAERITIYLDASNRVERASCG